MNASNQPVKPAAVRAPSYYSASLNFESDYPTLQGSVTVQVLDLDQASATLVDRFGIHDKPGAGSELLGH